MANDGFTTASIAVGTRPGCVDLALIIVSIGPGATLYLDDVVVDLEPGTIQGPPSPAPFLGQVLAAGGYNDNTRQVQASSELFNPLYSNWTATGTMNTPRLDFQMVRLNDGTALVAGGTTNNANSGITALSELYLPNGTWIPTASSMKSPRQDSAAVLLPNGSVLVAGGFDGSSYLASSEIYLPQIQEWILTNGPMNHPRGYLEMTLLSDGTVLAAGGFDGSSWLTSSEVYDPATSEWSLVGALSSGRGAFAMLVLPDTTVLAAGGAIGRYPPLATCELYNVSSQTWRLLPNSMAVPRQGPGAVILQDGTALVAGGYGGPYGPVELASSEVFNPSTLSWTSTANTMSSTRDGFAMVLLPGNGAVLAADGHAQQGYVDSSDLYNASSMLWSPTTGPPTTGRSSFEMILI